MDAVTHRRVAEVAGLPLASTTYWFQSKEHLLTAALESAAERDIERLRAFLREPPEGTADPLALAVGAILGPSEESTKGPPSGAADNPSAKAPPSGAADNPSKAPPSGAADNPSKAPPSGAADNPSFTSRGWLLATYALVLEAARRPALRDVTMRWTGAYLEALSPLLAAAGSRHPRSDAELLLAAADGLLVEQLASDDTSDLAPRLRRLADALVKA